MNDRHSQAIPSAPDRTAIRLNLSYRLPRPLHSDADDRRLANEDLPDLAYNDLAMEAWRIRQALVFGDLRRPAWAKEWLRERLAHCRVLLKATPREIRP